MADRLYLDHAATTPVIPAAREAMLRGIELWANPSSPHAAGRAARAALEDARARIKAALGWDGEVIFTSGASESVAIALAASTTDAVLATSIEHDAVLRMVPGHLPVGADGMLSAQVLGSRLAESGARRPLVAIQSVNSETGVIQPVAALAAIVRAANGLVFVDASQSAGKLPLPSVDLIAVSAHKLGGPPGVGALLVRDFAMLRVSGGQEQGYRGGTENLPGAMGFAAALEAPEDWVERAAGLRAHLDAAVEAAGGAIVARGSPRLATIASYRMPGVRALSQLIQFDLAGIAVSAGSACSSGTMKPSHVLAAMGWSEDDAAEVIRVSFGCDTTRSDVDRFIDTWCSVAESARRRAA